MYWLVGSLIILMMLGTLGVTEQLVLPNVLGLSSVLPTLLMTAAFLIWLNQRRALSATDQKLPFATNKPHSSLLKSRKWLRYIAITVGASLLIVLSMLQVISRHQQLETTAVTTTMRVQAWVTIEGISDSVYDPATDSGYRQVATLRHIEPLTADISQSSLDKSSAYYVFNKHTEALGSTKRSPAVRVLLSAYPRLSTSELSQAKATSSDKDDPLVALNQLRSGDQLLMHLTLAPLSKSEQAADNPTGFDSYRWLRARHLDGTANIMAIGAVGATAKMRSVPADKALTRLRRYIDRGRLQLRQHFYQNGYLDWETKTLDEQQAAAVTLSLLTGDRSLINRATKDLYQLAGISHLLAISGTHVLFLAIMLAGLAVGLCNRFCPTLYRYVPRWQVRWLMMIGTALIYALFTGFDVPAARTAWTLLAVGLVRFTLLPIGTLRVLLALAIIMAWLDPYVLWQAGYWLSFIAVALLLQYEAGQDKTDATNDPAMMVNTTMPKTTVMYHRSWLLFKRVFILQCWLFVALLPVTLLLFGKVSLWGLLINLFAIGLFGWVIVPMNLLAGLCYLLSPTLADGIWAIVITIVNALHEIIKGLTAMPSMDAWLYTPVNMAMLIMAALVLLPWLLSRGMLSRTLAVPPLTLLVMSALANQQALRQVPTLYVLPTGDRYVSALILSYPINDKKTQKTAQWLFLADHRAPNDQNRPSTLSADKLSQIINQHLHRLSVTHLDGIIVQSGRASLLPATATQLHKNIPTHHYWQAGQPLDKTQRPAAISTQSCQQGKTWQADGITLQALTGWREIDDSALQTCSIAIDSDKPIIIKRYDTTDPLKSTPLSGQSLTMTKTSALQQMDASRLILDAAIHPYSWQLWSLLCDAQLFEAHVATKATDWLTHSAAPIASHMLTTHQVATIYTYDDKPLTQALTLIDTP